MKRTKLKGPALELIELHPPTASDIHEKIALLYYLVN